jgi:hypothetical protein
MGLWGGVGALLGGILGLLVRDARLDDSLGTEPTSWTRTVQCSGSPGLGTGLTSWTHTVRWSSPPIGILTSAVSNLTLLSTAIRRVSGRYTR